MGCTHEILFVSATVSCASAVPAAQFCGALVSGTIAVRKRLRAAEAKNVFEARPPLHGPEGVDGTARFLTAEVDEPIRFLSFSILANLSKSYFQQLSVQPP